MNICPYSPLLLTRPVLISAASVRIHATSGQATVYTESMVVSSSSATSAGNAASLPTLPGPATSPGSAPGSGKANTTYDTPSAPRRHTRAGKWPRAWEAGRTSIRVGRNDVEAVLVGSVFAWSSSADVEVSGGGGDTVRGGREGSAWVSAESERSWIWMAALAAADV